MTTELPPFPRNRGPIVARKLRDQLARVDSLLASGEAVAEAMEEAFGVAFERHDTRSGMEQRIHDLANPPRQKRGI